MRSLSRKTKSTKESDGPAAAEPSSPDSFAPIDVSDAAPEPPSAACTSDTTPSAASADTSSPPAAPAAWRDVPGRPRCGFSTADASGLQLSDGDGTKFRLRIGPDYKKHGKKDHSARHIYQPITIDVLKRDKIGFHIADRLTLPPPPEGHDTPNDTGLPRRLVVNAVIPVDGPPLIGGGGHDGACYQIVITFGASAEALAAWKAGGSPAYKLFARFLADAPEGVTPSSGDIDIKERLKLLPFLENIKVLGLPGWIAGYNGKPALVTKSGSIYKGDDYLEVCMNTFRFGFLTKKGVHYLRERYQDFHLHVALTLEGRPDEELPEQVLLACRIRGLALSTLASTREL